MSIPIITVDRYGKGGVNGIAYCGDEKANETRAQIEYLQKIIPEWIDRLQMGFWDIRVTYELNAKPSDDKGDGGLARCWTRWEYRSANITFYMTPLQGYSNEELEEILVHELMHIYVRPMRMWWPESMEDNLMSHCMSMEEMVCNNLHIAIVHMKRKMEESKQCATQ